MTPLRFAVFGAGFWARYQLAAWQELEGVECVAICDKARAKAETLAQQAGVRGVYDDPSALLDREEIDFVDVITDLSSHSDLVHLVASRKLPVICQKPMGPSLEIAERMVAVCRAAGAPFFVHENWRWQAPLRQLKQALDSGQIGTPFRVRIQMNSGFPVFINQPWLKELEQFMVAEMGSHILDVPRFLFGEAESVYCQVHRVHADIKGEDVATVMLKMAGGPTVLCDMAFAGNPLEHDRFPETYAFVEADRGSVELGPDFWLRVTTADGTHARRCAPPRYAWADPDYAVVHTSMVSCNANLLQALRGEGPAETTGEDNLKTLRLVSAAYDSVRSGQAIRV